MQRMAERSRDNRQAIEEQGFKNSPGLFMSIRRVSLDYRVTAYDGILFVETSRGAITLTLPRASETPGRVFALKDVDGDADVSPITVEPLDDDFIDGGTSLTMDREYGSVFLQSDGDNWFKITSAGAATTNVPFDHGNLLGLNDDDHTQYMHNSVARNVTAQHTFAPTSAQAPFVLGANAQGQLVTGLNADQLEGLEPSSNPGAAEHILKSTAAGELTLEGLTIDNVDIDGNAVAATSGDLSLQAAVNVNLAPTGDVVLNPGGNDVLPLNKYTVNLGSLQNKYLTLHAAELWVETLVAQDTMATMGGRILVGPTTELIADAAPADSTIDVKHNNLSNGDVVYLEANAKVEFMQVTSGATAITGGYRYSVSRNLDISGSNQWHAGDAVFNTGQTGNGFIDLYSYGGVVAGNGPTIVGNVRSSATYNDWTEHWAIGNLNGNYGYGTDTFGVGLGKYDIASGNNYVTIDASNGVRFFDGSTVRAQLTSTTWTLGNTSTEHVQVTSAALRLKTGTTVHAELNGSNLVLGDTAGENVRVTSTQLEFRDGSTVYGILNGDQWRIGQVANNSTRVIIDAANGFRIYHRDGGGADNLLIQFDASGDGYLKNNLTVDTGVFTAGGGRLEIDSAGMHITTTNGGVPTGARIRIEDDTFGQIGEIFAETAGLSPAWYWLELQTTGGGGESSIQLVYDEGAALNYINMSADEAWVGGDLYMFNNPIRWDNQNPVQSKGIRLMPNTLGGLDLQLIASQTAGVPIFRVLSTGGSERLRVEHSGETYTSNSFRSGGGITSGAGFTSGSANSNFNSGTLFVDAAAGNVAVGGTNPDSRFWVYGNRANEYIARFENDGNNNNRSGLGIYAGADTNPTHFAIGFHDGNNTVIGSVQGNGSGGVQYNTTSDERLKQDMKPVEGVLDRVDELRVITYRGVGSGGRRTAGLISQDVERLFPEIVVENPDGMKMFDYGVAGALLAARGLQETKSEIDALKDAVQLLEGRIAQLEAA